jgi:hypothetical protein
MSLKEKVGCTIATRVMCLNDEEIGQIGGSNVWDAGDDENAAACYRSRRSRIHLEKVASNRH